MMMRHAVATTAIPVRLVLLEDGARFPVVDDADQDGDRELVVVAQAADEHATDFALRALERISSLESAHKQAAVAMLAVSPRPAHAPRTVTAHALLRHLVRAGRGMLVISAKPDDDEPERQVDLMTLAGSLTAEIGGTPIVVRVRFEREEDAELEKSGVRWAIHPPQDDVDQFLTMMCPD